MSPDDFSINYFNNELRIYYDDYAVIMLRADGLHRIDGQPSCFPTNTAGQIKVLRAYQHKYYHSYYYDPNPDVSKTAVHEGVVEFGSWKFLLEEAGNGVALVAFTKNKYDYGNTAYTVLTIDELGLDVAGSCTFFKSFIALDDKHRVRVWRK